MKQQLFEKIVITFFDENQSKTKITFKRSGTSYLYEEVELKVDWDEYEELIIKRIDKSQMYREQTEEIIYLFLEENKALLKKVNVESESGIEATEEQIPDITVPYNPNAIKIQPARFSLKEIYEMIKGEEDFEPMLDLSPDFQRNYVWDRTRKSRLIESILLQIPLPVIYLARDYEGKYQVVDGVQRLSVVEEYFSNGFRLVNLEYLSDECEGKYYNKKDNKSLHAKFVRQLRTYQIDCYVIEPSTPIDVKFDIFKRLNTGGKSLNNQEIRNSIMRSEVRDFIRKLADTEEFKKATKYTIKPTRMMDQEFALRFIAFYMLYKENYLGLEYNSNMHSFLNIVVDKMNENYLDIPFDLVEKQFRRAMTNAYILFGDEAFRKVKLENRNKNVLINKSLFTSFSVLLSGYNLSGTEPKLIEDFASYLSEKEYLYQCITYGTSEKVRIDTTFMLIENYLQQRIGDSNDL